MTSDAEKARSICERVLNWCQENHGMSPYLRTSLNLEFQKEIAAALAQVEREALAARVVLPEKFETVGIPTERHHLYWCSGWNDCRTEVARLNGGKP